MPAHPYDITRKGTIMDRSSAKTAALALTEQAVSTIRPNEDQERTRLLKASYALFKWRELATDPKFGRDHVMTLGYLDVATDMADANGADIDRGMTKLLPPVSAPRLFTSILLKDRP